MVDHFTLVGDELDQLRNKADTALDPLLRRAGANVYRVVRRNH